MVRRVFHCWVIGIVCLTDCAPDNSGEIQTSIAQQGNSAPAIEQLKLQNIPGIKSVDLWENKYGPGLRLTTTHYQI